MTDKKPIIELCKTDQNIALSIEFTSSVVVLILCIFAIVRLDELNIYQQVSFAALLALQIGLLVLNLLTKRVWR